MHACLRFRTLVDTNVLLLYELRCSVQGRLNAVLLCLLCVDTAVAFGAWFVPAWCAQKKKSRFENQNFVVVCDPPAYIWQSELIIQQALSKKSTSPAVMFTSRLVLPSAMTWTEKSACVANCHAHTNTHAHASCCCCYDIAVLLRLIVVQQLLVLLLLPSLVLSRHSKRKAKKRKKKTTNKRKKMKREFFVDTERKTKKTYVHTAVEVLVLVGGKA